MDVLFVIDTSDETDVNVIQNFETLAIKLVNRLDVGQDDVRFAAIVYGESPLVSNNNNNTLILIKITIAANPRLGGQCRQSRNHLCSDWPLQSENVWRQEHTRSSFCCESAIFTEHQRCGPTSRLDAV